MSNTRTKSTCRCKPTRKCLKRKLFSLLKKITLVTLEPLISSKHTVLQYNLFNLPKFYCELKHFHSETFIRNDLINNNCRQSFCKT